MLEPGGRRGGDAVHDLLYLIGEHQERVEVEDPFGGCLLCARQGRLAVGESVIKYKSPLNVLTDTYEYDHSCY